MESSAPQPDPRDVHIANLEAQCAALQLELQRLKLHVDPSLNLLPPERAGGATAVLEVYWNTATMGYCAQNSFQAVIPQGGFVSTRYVLLPADAVGDLRIDPGNQPGLWLLEKISLHNVTAEGVLESPAAAIWDPLNSFAGLESMSGAIILPDPHPSRPAVFKVICWDGDPQLRLPLPANPEGRVRVLTLSAAALDPAHALMAQHGQQLLDQIAALKGAQSR